jgi:hypothetical protein
MLTLTSSAGQTWHLTDAQAEAFAKLVTPRSLHVVGEIVHSFPCRHAQMYETRGEPVPACRWAKDDTAGGYSCAECGTWAQPDSERARVLSQIGLHELDITKAKQMAAQAGLVHVTNIRTGDTFRFENETETLVAFKADYLGEGYMHIMAGDRSIHCSDNATTGERCMVEIIARGQP